MDNNIDITKQVDTLRESEQYSRRILDQAIITLSSSFIALIFGFFKDISLYIEYSTWLKILFLAVIFFFIVAIALNLYSHIFAEKMARDMQYVCSGREPYLTKNFDDKNKRLKLLNNIHFGAFIFALISIFIMVGISIFNPDSDNKQLIKTNQPTIQIIQKVIQ